MTFTNIVDEVCDRLNLTSTEAVTRVGREVNARYKRITSSIGLVTSRRVTVQATATPGVRTLVFSGIEKINAVIDRSSGSDLVLQEVTYDDLHNIPVGEICRNYAIDLMGDSTVTIRMDCTPQTAFTLYADGLDVADTLSGGQIPAFPESFHDILVFGAVADELRKMEKTQLARDAEADFERRLSDLRGFITKSAYLDIYQGKTKSTQRMGASGGSGSSSGVVNGTTSWTQTGLITFDRDPDAPFGVTSGSALVPWLNADKLDGQEGSEYHDAGNLTGAIADARLSSNVPLKNGTNAFTGSNSFAGFPFDLIGGQMKFPGAQNASSNANTLDDYEEGSWTPSDTSGAGLVFTGVSGSYVKIGQMVFACANLIYPVNVSALATSIGGLPFASQAAVPYFGCTINYTTVGVGFTILQIISGQVLALFALDGVAMINSTWSSKELRFTAIYRAGA